MSVIISSIDFPEEKWSVSLHYSMGQEPAGPKFVNIFFQPEEHEEFEQALSEYRYKLKHKITGTREIELFFF